MRVALTPAGWVGGPLPEYIQMPAFDLNRVGGQVGSVASFLKRTLGYVVELSQSGRGHIANDFLTYYMPIRSVQLDAGDRLHGAAAESFHYEHVAHLRCRDKYPLPECPPPIQ